MIWTDIFQAVVILAGIIAILIKVSRLDIALHIQVYDSIYIYDIK